MHAEEVNLDHTLPLVVDAHRRRNGADERHQTPAFDHTHATMPLLAPAGRLQRPLEKLRLIVEAEHAVVILDVVLVQQRVQLFQHQRIVQRERVPCETRREAVGFSADLRNWFIFFDWFVDGDFFTWGIKNMSKFYCL